tara:strand:+ start:521 stop:1564 length:1044 start_codon:yes stop_codon:yes gene_type:complete
MGMIKLPKSAVEFYEDNYREIFASGNLAEGIWSEKICEWACSYTSSKYSLAVNSNGAGILSILNVLKMKLNKKRIFLQSNTMYGVKTMSITSGLELIGYVDCSIDYLMPTYDQVKSFVQKIEDPSDCVFLITHIGGWVNPDIREIAALCAEKEITLIEDCAHSLGATLDSEHTGLFGDAGVYSLYATKAVPAGEGGIIVTNNEKIYNMTSKYSIYDRFDQELDLGVNNRMSEINALICYSVLRETEEIIKNKMEVAEKYISACEKNNWSFIDPLSGGQRSNLYKFILLARTNEALENFKKIKNRTSPVYDYALGNDSYDIQNKHICLPIWFELENSEIDEVLSQLSS